MVQSLRDNKAIMLDRLKLASLKMEKSGNEKMYQFGEKIAKSIDDRTAKSASFEVDGNGLLISKQGGTDFQSWVNKHHTESNKIIDDKIKGVEASLASKGTGEGSTKVKKTDSLYKRSSFRKGTRVKAESEAPKNASGKMICPTCGKDIPDSITINTKNGPVKRIGYDLDHYPDTWAERVVSMKTGEVKPTRKEVLDEYNARLRVQCHECNISHKFEGIEGTYKGEIKE